MSETLKQLKERFWAQVEDVSFLADEDCWNWIGARCVNGGHGTFSLKDRRHSAQRISYWLHRDYANSNLLTYARGHQFVCHKCDNPTCINPSHLYLGTHKTNTYDRDSKSRGNVAKGIGHYRAKLSIEQVIEIRRRYHDGETNFAKLATNYGVTNGTICDLVKYNTWKHVK